MPITLLGVSLLVFCITRFVPGGPIDQLIQQQTADALSGHKPGVQQGDNKMSEADQERLEEQFGLQEHILLAYSQWLGIAPKKIHLSKQDYKTPPTNLPTAQDGWNNQMESPQDRAQRWATRYRVTDAAVINQRAGTYCWRVISYQTEYAGLLQGTLGLSFKYNEPVWGMIRERIPVSLYFGILTALITYTVSIPLGIAKAMHHKSWFDHVTSVLVFLGYSVPGFAIGALLVVYLGARLDWFPLGGLTSIDFDTMSLWGQVLDLAHHTVLPLLCYVIGCFAYTTMLMKNSLMENLSADYMRTAVSKGVSFRRAVVTHALRNSFIPIATALGGIIPLLIGGSMLIERVFDIQGFGVLSYQALMDKDYSLIMGCLVISALLMIVGHLISDILVAIIDPRVQFE